MRGLLLLQTLFAATAALAFREPWPQWWKEYQVVPFQAYRDDAGEVLPLSQGVSVLVAESYPEQYYIEVQTLVPVVCACPKNIVIPLLCGPDGVQYDNECLAECRGVPASKLVQLDNPEASCPTPEPCPCVAMYYPQCGPDGTFYSNPSCASGCSGVAEDALRPWSPEFGLPEGQCTLPEETWSQLREPGLKDVGLQSRPWRLKNERWLEPGKSYTLGLRVKAGAGAGLPMAVEVRAAARVRRNKPWRPLEKCMRKCKTSGRAPVCTRGGQVWTDCDHFCARPNEVIADLECWKAAEPLAEAEFTVGAESALRTVEFTVPANAPRKTYQVKVFVFTGLDHWFHTPGTDVGYYNRRRTVDMDLAVVCANDDQPCLDALGSAAAPCAEIATRKDCNGLRDTNGLKLCKWIKEDGLCAARREVQLPNSEPPCVCCPGSATKCVRPPEDGP